jgi:hypothetical protein
MERRFFVLQAPSYRLSHLPSLARMTEIDMLCHVGVEFRLAEGNR